MKSIFDRVGTIVSRIGVRLLALVLILLTFGAAERLNAQDPSPGSMRLVIKYRCRAADRPAFLEAMRTDGTKRFDGWRNDGVISDYLLMFNTVCDTGTWDMMAVLSFATYDHTARWYDIEEKFPGGLTPELLKIATPVETHLAESKWSFGKPGDRRSAVYMVIPYNHPDRTVYTNFVNAVLVPQFEGWMREGALRAWSILLTSHYPGRPYDIWLILEYDGINGLAHRNSARDATAALLEKDPGWSLLRKVSEAYRSEHEVTIARAVTTR